MNIVVLVDRLILDGVSLAPHEHGQFRAALESELARLLADGGLGGAIAAGGAQPSIAGGVVEPGAERAPASLGAGVARAVYAGIGSAQHTEEGK